MPSIIGMHTQCRAIVFELSWLCTFLGPCTFFGGLHIYWGSANGAELPASIACIVGKRPLEDGSRLLGSDAAYWSLRNRSGRLGVPEMPMSHHKDDSEPPKGEAGTDPPKPEKNPAAVALGRRGGLTGGKARAAKMTKEQRAESARNAANARWKKPRD